MAISLRFVKDEGPPKVLSIEGFPVRISFSLMSAGNMSERFEDADDEARKNRSAVLNMLGINQETVVRMRPEHRSALVQVDHLHSGRILDCDGLLTTDPNISLMILPADAVPLVLTDTEGSFVHLVNAGVWSVDKGIVRFAIDEVLLQFVNNDPRQIRALIGPGIGLCHYESLNAASRLKRDEWGQHHLITKDKRINLNGLIIHDLLAAKVPRNNIDNVNLCTWCAVNPFGDRLFFSDLRASRVGDENGRFAAVTTIGAALP